jgi:hypothetical protein
MAKNKNRDRKQPRSERAQHVSESPALEPQDEQRASQVTTVDMARKGRQKRFGHN